MTTTIAFHVGDVRDVMAGMPADSVDLIVTSPPFLALRSYLPADHELKAKEIGSEATPAAFLETLCELTQEWRRLLTRTGSLCVEIGDTYSGSGGGGGDYLVGGLREGQPGFGGSAERAREGNAAHWRQKAQQRDAWPLAKSLCGIPTLYTWSLAYGRNLLNPDMTFAPWRIRNLLTWTRPNPPVGALGDKFRPATSFVTVACTAQDRWFDLDAVRQPHGPPGGSATPGPRKDTGSRQDDGLPHITNGHSAGAPPLDWWDETADWQPLHRLPTAPYKGAHYATYPLTLPRRLIEAMCPREVCTACGEPRRRIVGFTDAYAGSERMDAEHLTLGWSDCECPVYPPHGCEPPCGHDVLAVALSREHRPGVVFDPFAGSGTTAIAAALCGRDAILADLDARNVALCDQRISESLHIVSTSTSFHDGIETWTWTVRNDLPGLKHEHPGQASLFHDEVSA